MSKKKIAKKKAGTLDEQRRDALVNFLQKCNPNEAGCSGLIKRVCEELNI